MKKLILCIVCVLAFAPFVPVFSSAATLTTVTSPLPEPTSSYTVNSNGTVTIKFAYVYQNIAGINNPEGYEETGGTFLNMCEATYTVPPTCCYFGAQQSWLSNNESGAYQTIDYGTVTDASRVIYDVVTGELLISQSYDGFKFQYGYFPQAVAGEASKFCGGWWIVPEQITHMNTETTPFVTWSQVTPENITVRSHLSEPVFDDNNYYFVEIGEDESYLYWLSLYDLQALTQLTMTELSDGEQSLYIESQTMPYNIEYWIPTITYTTDGGTTLMLFLSPEIDPQNLIRNSLAYELTFSKYNLESGELIQSTTLSGTIENAYLNLGLDSYFMADSDVLAVRSYGFYWANLGSRLVNLASVIWSVDPVIDSWRSNTTELLEQIRDAVQGDSSEVTTVSTPDFFGQIEEVQGQLTITNADGESPHGGGGRDFFDNADSGIENIATPLSFVREFYDTYIKDEPILYLPLIVALALGVAITILGKDKSD